MLWPRKSALLNRLNQSIRSSWMTMILANTCVAPSNLLRAARVNLSAVLRQAMTAMKPQALIPTQAWSQKYLKLPAENSDTPGDYDLYYAPYLYGIFAAFDDPDIPEIVC